MFQIQWLRRLIRRNTNPIPRTKAEIWKNRLSILYAVIAWNAFGGVLYMFYNGKRDWADAYGYKSEEEKALTPAQYWARTLQIKNAKVMRVQGLNVSEIEDIKTENYNEIVDELLQEGKY